MQPLTGFAWLLACQTAGELLAHALALPLPGPVVGLLLLLPALRSTRIREAVAGTADFLLAHLSLLFVPVAVGVVVHLHLLSAYGVRLLLILVLSTWAGLAATVLVLRRAERSDAPGNAEDDASGEAGNASIC